MAVEAGTSATSVFGLLQHHGRDVAGAIQLLPPGEVPSDARKKSVTTVQERLSDTELEQLLRETTDRYSGKPVTTFVTDAFKFSVAGAQPKIALTADENEDFLPPSKEFPTTHIIKPNDPQSSSYIKEMDILEVMCLAAARRVGLDAANAYLWYAPSGTMSAVVTERYDRAINEDGTIDRLHQEDFCQAMSVLPEKKYQHQHGGPGLNAISKFLESTLPAVDAPRVILDLFRAAVFNVGIVGTDAHAKNYSLMIEGSTVSLAPLYDTISAASHVQIYDKVFFPMKINDSYNMMSITPDGLVKAGTKMGIPEQQAHDSVYSILCKLPGAIEDVAAEMGEVDLGQSVLDGLAQFSPVRYI